MRRAAIALGFVALLVARRADACDRDGFDILTGIAAERLDTSATNAKLVAAGYETLPSMRTSVGPALGFRVHCSRWHYMLELLRWRPGIESRGPNASRATLGSGSFIGFDLSWSAYARSGWDLSPFVLAEIAASWVKFEAPGSPVLPQGMFASQEHWEVPIHLGFRISKMLDTSSSSFFGYAEPGREGAGPVVGLEAGVVVSPGGKWYEDSQGMGNLGPSSAISGLTSTGPFVRLVVGWGIWHAGRGPWAVR